MKIRLSHLDERVADLIESNNQNKDWKQAANKKLDSLDSRLKKLEDYVARKKSHEY